MALACVSALDTTTKLQIGPFTMSVDLGFPCNDNDIDIGKPISSDPFGGNIRTTYSANVCNILVRITGWEKERDSKYATSKSGITTELAFYDVIDDTISTFDYLINGKSIAGAKGSQPNGKMFYIAAFYISPKSYCYLSALENETMMTALKSVNITES
jgi:hypothetical protein